MCVILTLNLISMDIGGHKGIAANTRTAYEL